MGLLNGLGHRQRPFELQERALEIELFRVCPELADNIHPFGEIIVARIMLEQFDPEHVEFGPVPSSDDVEPEPPAGNMVDGRALLGDHQRMDRRGVAGGKQGHVLRRHGQRGRPGEGIQDEIATVGEGSLARGLPAGQAENGLEARAIDNLCQAQRALPGRALGVGGARLHGADGVGRECAELEFVVVEDRIAADLMGCRHPVSPH